jgi:hypothetical protein
LILSIIGAILVVLIVFVIPFETKELLLLDKIIVGSVFIIICIIGITLAFWPGWIGDIFLKDQTQVGHQNSVDKNRKIKGHHLDCDNFNGHRFAINNKILCAGCIGLAGGSALAIFLMILYLIIPFHLSQLIYQILILIGFTFIGLNYIEVVIIKRNPKVHLGINTLLPVSFFFITIAVLELTGELAPGLIVIIILFLWLDTRIQLSKWHHDYICEICNEKCARKSV